MKAFSISKALDVVSGLLFVFMFLVFIVEVFFRYVLNSPISWSMEIIMVSFLVMLFWTLTFSVPLKRHVAFTVVRDLVPPTVKRIFAIVAHLACAAILVASLPAILSMAAYEMRESTPMLRIPLSVNYGVFALFIAAYVVRLAVALITLFRSTWRAEI